MKEVAGNVAGHNGIQINAARGRALGIAEGDRIEVRSAIGAVTGRAAVAGALEQALHGHGVMLTVRLARPLVMAVKKPLAIARVTEAGNIAERYTRSVSLPMLFLNGFGIVCIDRDPRPRPLSGPQTQSLSQRPRVAC
jgi:hypothetical protein